MNTTASMTPAASVDVGAHTPAALPAFVHDCPRCTFLGGFRGADLYHCEQITGPTVIARYGSYGPDYTSGLLLANSVPELGEAKRRAEAAGLLSRAMGDRP